MRADVEIGEGFVESIAAEELHRDPVVEDDVGGRAVEGVGIVARALHDRARRAPLLQDVVERVGGLDARLDKEDPMRTSEGLEVLAGEALRSELQTGVGHLLGYI